jgi:TonB family protein
MHKQVVPALVGAAIGEMITTTIAISVRPDKPPPCPDASECPKQACPVCTQPAPPSAAFDAGVAEADIDAGTDLGDLTCNLDEVACLLADRPPPCCAMYQSSRRTPMPPPDDPLTADQIRRVVMSLRVRIAACADRSSIPGTVKVSVKVLPDGNVGHVEVKSTPDAALGDCVARIMRAARFPASGQGVTFTYPFVF